MVQLKVPRSTISSISSEFQFLMVQLKVFVNKTKSLHVNISIPYGSIKRLWTASLASPSVISIPYGSIKSSGRLPRVRPCRFISIPYGSIKSCKYSFAV